jgi:hypothetical protein
MRLALAIVVFLNNSMKSNTLLYIVAVFEIAI